MARPSVTSSVLAGGYIGSGRSLGVRGVFSLKGSLGHEQQSLHQMAGREPFHVGPEFGIL